MAEALVAVKKDLGKDAVILRTRSFKQGAFFGIGGRTMVEITASDDPRAIAPRQVKAAMAKPERAAEQPVTASMSNAVARAYGVPAAAMSEPIAKAPAPKPQAPAASELMPVASGGVASIGRMALRSAGSSANDEPITESLRDELAAIKRMVGQVLQSSALSAGEASNAGTLTMARPATAMPDALLKFYVRLIQNEVARELADDVIAKVRDELTPGEMTDEGVVRQTILRHLEALLPVAENIAVPPLGRRIDGRPQTIALVGPTGVGKTTTIAKLAAAYKLRHGKKVGLITSDTYRIAAVDQLRTYANIIGVPLKVVLTPDDMTAACQAFSDMDVILIDTAGRSPGDGERLEELRVFVQAANPHHIHLVLSSVVSEASMLRTADKFAVLKPNLVIFTKLDEAANFGVLVNVVQRIDAKLSFVTTGQEVPDDLEAGRPDRLARLVLDGAAT